MPSLNYPDASLHEVMRATARRYPGRTAVRFENRAITFSEFDLESNRLANALHQLGLSDGDRLGIFLPNSPEWELGAYAASKLGAVICPLNSAYRSFEIAHVLNDSSAKILIAHSKLWPFVAAVRQDLRTVIAYVIVGDAVPVSPQTYSYATLVRQQSAMAPKVHAYSVSKAGLIALAKTVAREVARLRILVNVVEPGWVRTPLTESLPQSVRDAVLAESLVGRYVEPGDVAAAVTFLCGPGAQQITGQILRVDGGQSLGSV